MGKDHRNTIHLKGCDLDPNTAAESDWLDALNSICCDEEQTECREAVRRRHVESHLVKEFCTKYMSSRKSRGCPGFSRSRPEREEVV